MQHRGMIRDFLLFNPCSSGYDGFFPPPVKAERKVDLLLY